MNKPSYRVSCCLLTVVLVLSGCGPLYLSPLPTQVPGAVDTIVAMTYAAAATQTALFLPTATDTPTETATPTKTRLPPTGTPTPTATFFFTLRPPTKYRSPTPIPTSSGVSSGNSGSYQCRKISQNPSNSTKFSPSTNFDVKWRVKNTGTSRWDSGSVDYIYIRGQKMHTQAIYDLPSDVKPGGSVDIVVDMTSPNSAGTYSTTWSLRIGKTNFCSLKLIIVVL